MPINTLLQTKARASDWALITLKSVKIVKTCVKLAKSGN